MDPGPDSCAADSAHGFVSRVFGCAPDVAEQIMRHAKPRSYPLHAVIVRQGDRLEHAYLLVVGRAHALLYTIDGQALLLHEFRVGDLFGALAEADPVQERADIIAVERVEALQLESRDLVMLAERYGSIGLALSRLMLKRLRQTTARMYERAALSAVGRVYSELLRQAREAEDLTIRPIPVIAELALNVATTRETASRAINALERRGIIRRDADGLVLVAPHRLEELVL